MASSIACPNSLHRGAMGLTMQDQQVDRDADIIDCRPFENVDMAGLGVHFHFAGMGAVWIAADPIDDIPDAFELEG